MSDSQNQNSSPSYEPQYEKSGVSVGFWVLVGIVVLSVVLGLLAHYKLRGSADVVSKAQKQFGLLGKKQTMQQCVKSALKWNKSCAGLKILCQASIPRVVGACLEARKRVQVCRSLDMGKSSSHFSYRQCKPFGFKKRQDQKSCVLAFNTVFSYCFHLRGGKLGKAVKASVPTPRRVEPAKRRSSAPPPRRGVGKPGKRTP